MGEPDGRMNSWEDTDLPCRVVAFHWAQRLVDWADRRQTWRDGISQGDGCPGFDIAELIGYRLEVLTTTTATRKFEAIPRHGSSGA